MKLKNIFKKKLEIQNMKTGIQNKKNKKGVNQNQSKTLN